MPAKPKTKPKSVSAKTTPKRTRTLLSTVFLLILIVAASALLVHHRQQIKNRQAAATLAADKATFATVETEMAAAYNNIVSIAGKPDYIATHKRCGRSEIKYSEGRLICEVVYDFAYKDKDGSTAYVRAGKVEDSFKGRSQLKLTGSKFTDQLDHSNTARFIAVEVSEPQGVSCKIDLDYLQDDFQSGLSDFKSKPSSRYELMCSKQIDQDIFAQAQ